MPQAPYALLRASINGGAVTTGGITVPASATVQLSADPSASVGANLYKYEIYGYPTGFTVPAGWSTGASGVYFYNSSSTPPSFTLPSIANWGKFMLRLTLNNAISTNSKVIPPTQLVDESTALSMLSPNGLADLGLFESNQFNTTWTPTMQAGLRAIDTAVTAVSGANQKPPVQLVATSNIGSLSGEQTIDSVMTSASRVLLVAQSSAAQNGPWLTGSGAWVRPVDFASDAQVIVGQTFFVTAGTINNKTNWQLTSGSTIAGSKTFSALVGASSVTILQPVDAVATSNNALSGTTSVDGVTLTASVTRVLAVAQSTPAQNGPWVAQAGAWTRPSDFTTDAQVVTGQSVFVKTGGTLGAGTSWQLTSGSTIAGSKTYSQIISGKGLPPVRLVQTVLLAAYTYDSSAKTITGNVNGSIGITIFDGIIPSVGDSVLVVFEGTKNGIYVVTAVGDASHQYILTRRADLSKSSSFLGGIQVDVLDGASVSGNSRGSRWAMTNLATVTLDSTSTTWIPMREKDAKEVDLSKEPYLVKDYSNANSAINAFLSGADPDFGTVISRAWFENPAGTRFRLPTSKGGIINCVQPITLHFLSQIAPLYKTLCGAGRDRTTLQRYSGGGHVMQASSGAPPPIFGTAVDTAANATPFVMFDPVNAFHSFFNLSHAGLRVGASPYGVVQDLSIGWTNFELRMAVRFTSLGTNEHIISCGGKRLGSDVTDIMFRLMHLGSGVIQGKLRSKDTVAGVFGAITHSGSGASVMTADSSVKPADDFGFVVRVENGGTVGVAGIQLAYSLNGGVSYYPAQALGTNTSLWIWNTQLNTRVGTTFAQPAVGDSLSVQVDKTSWMSVGTTVRINFGGFYLVTAITDSTHCTLQNLGDPSGVSPGTNVNADRPIFQVYAKFNFTAASMVALDTYSTTVSGVWQNAVLSTPGGTVAINTNYIITLANDGSNTKLYVSVAGAARDTGPNSLGTQNVVQTGVFKQRCWEQINLGRNQNQGYKEGASAFNPAAFIFGSMRLMGDIFPAVPTSVVTPPATTETTIAKARGAGQRFHWCPISTETNSLRNSGGVLTGPDGIVNYWLGEFSSAPNANQEGAAWIVSRGNTSGGFIHNLAIEDLSVVTGGGTISKSSGIFLQSPVSCEVKRVGLYGAYDGLEITGPAFFSEFGPFTAQCGGTNLSLVNGSLAMSGESNINGGETCLGMSQSANIVGDYLIFYNSEEAQCVAPFILDAVGGELKMIFDDENGVTGECTENIRISVLNAQTFAIRGTLGSGFQSTSPIAVGAPGSGSFGPLTLEQLVLHCSAQTPCFVSSLTAAPLMKQPQVLEGLGVQFLSGGNTPICDRPNRVQRYGKNTSGTPLGDADLTVNAIDHVLHVCPSGTLTAARNFTAGTNGQLYVGGTTSVGEGSFHIFRFAGAQSFAANIVDGFSGATLFTLAVGKQGEIEVGLEITAAFPRGQFVIKRVSIY